MIEAKNVTTYAGGRINMKGKTLFLYWRAFVLGFFLVASFFTGTVFGASASRPNAAEILAIGSSAITNGNVAQAKDNAISQALLKGMERYLVDRVGSEGMINNFGRLVGDVLPNAREGIENFHVLASGQTVEKYYVLIRLRVNQKVTDARLQKAGVVILKGPAIKVLFMVSERNEGQLDYWWKYADGFSPMSSVELALLNAFQRRGCSPLNSRVSIPEDELSEEMRSSSLSQNAAVAWGRLYGADVVITGRAEVTDREKVFLLLKAIRVSEGDLICQAERSEAIQKEPENNVVQISEAFSSLTDQLASRIVPMIIQSVDATREQINQVAATLSGLKNYRQFKDFRNFLLKYVPGVKAVKQTSVSKGSISVEIGYEGSAAKLLEAVLKHEKLPLLMDAALTPDGRILIEIE